MLQAGAFKWIREGKNMADAFSIEPLAPFPTHPSTALIAQLIQSKPVISQERRGEGRGGRTNISCNTSDNRWE
jgi:hypothetical protein